MPKSRAPPPETMDLGMAENALEAVDAADAQEVRPRTGPDEGGAESQGREFAKAQSRMQAYARAQKQMQQEETEDYINELAHRGELTEGEHQKLMARRNMRGATDQPGVDGHAAAFVGVETSDMMLQKHLSIHEDPPFTRILKHRFGIYRIERCVRREKKRRANPKFVHMSPRLHRFVSHSAFDIVVGIVMVANGVLIGVAASAPADGSDPEGARNLEIAEHAFTFLFVLEIVLRMLSDGWIWIFERANMIDSLLIFVTGILPLWILQPIGGFKSAAMRGLAVLRIIRLIRLIRLVRTISWLRIFWTLIQGVIDSLRLLTSTWVLIGMALYTLAVFCTYAIGRVKLESANAGMANEYFGDVAASMFTIFHTMTLDSWAGCCRTLGRTHSMVTPMLILSIMIMTLVMANLITAVIVHNAFVRLQADEELFALMKREAIEKDIMVLCDMFDEMDTDGNGMLSLEEYDEARTRNGVVQDKLTVLGLDEKEQVEFWSLMANKGGEEASVDEFADTLRRAQGGAKSKDVYTILRRIDRSCKEVDKMHVKVQKRQEQIEGLRELANDVKKNMAMLFEEIGGFLHDFDPCFPQAPCRRTIPQIKKLRTIMDDKFDKLDELKH